MHGIIDRRGVVATGTGETVRNAIQLPPGRLAAIPKAVRMNALRDPRRGLNFHPSLSCLIASPAPRAKTGVAQAGFAQLSRPRSVTDVTLGDGARICSARAEIRASRSLPLARSPLTYRGNDLN